MLMIGHPEIICCPKLDHLGKKGAWVVLAVFYARSNCGPGRRRDVVAKARWLSPLALACNHHTDGAQMAHRWRSNGRFLLGIRGLLRRPLLMGRFRVPVFADGLLRAKDVPVRENWNPFVPTLPSVKDDVVRRQDALEYPFIIYYWEASHLLLPHGHERELDLISWMADVDCP
jgi:hypothetical protein